MLINVLQCFYERKPPSPARAVPTPHLAFHAPPFPHNHTSPTAQRPTPPASQIQAQNLISSFTPNHTLKSPNPKTPHPSPQPIMIFRVIPSSSSCFKKHCGIRLNNLMHPPRVFAENQPSRHLRDGPHRMLKLLSFSCLLFLAVEKK